MKFIQTKLYGATMYQRSTFLNDLRLSRSHQYVFYVYRKSHSNVYSFLVVIFSGLLSFSVLSLFNRLYGDLCRSGCSWYSRENSFCIYPALFHFHLIPLVALRLRFYLSFCPLVSIPVLSPLPASFRSSTGLTCSRVHHSRNNYIQPRFFVSPFLRTLGNELSYCKIVSGRL